MTEIIKEHVPFDGCDVAVVLDSDRPIRLLQLTDMQVIDGSQRRFPDRIRIDEINAWTPENFDIQLGNHIRSVVTQTNPDVIFITGDMVYGSFDDSGESFKWFVSLMESFGIPWAPVFGNHDNESKRGVKWQCELLEGSKNCLFKRGSVTGNGNYTVGIAVGDTLKRVMYMTDSNGCSDCSDPEVVKAEGIFPDQLERIRESSRRIKASQGRPVKGLMAFHIPTKEFTEVEKRKGYPEKYVIGVDVPSKDGDFGFHLDGNIRSVDMGDGFAFMKECGIDSVFVGHYHSICTRILCEDILWVYGLKTGQYDSHTPGSLGGTLIIDGDGLPEIIHVPALVHLAPYPGQARIFNGFFAEDKVIL